MSRIIELRWSCSECEQTDILGRHKRCPSCGISREKGEMHMDGADDYGADGRNTAATVTDSELLALANAGADWFCTRCDTGNRGDGAQCTSCGAPREGEAAEELTAVEKAVLRRRLEQRKAKRSDDEDWDDELAAAGVMTGLAAGGGLATMGLVALAAMACVIFAVGLSVWGNQTYQLTGQFTSLSWQHDTIKESWVQVQRGGFKSDLRTSADRDPVNGTGEAAGLEILGSTCRQEHHHYEQYVCGSHQVCTDVYRTETESYACTSTIQVACGETCSDNGNGFATCTTRYCSETVSDTCTRSTQVFSHQDCRDVPDYCDRSITAEYCDYLTHQWQESQRATATGSTHDTHWKDLSPGPLDRIVQTAGYEAAVAYTMDGETLRRTAVTNDEATFQRWNIGDSVTVTRKNMGDFEEIRWEGQLLQVR